jgi:hypothetical protein
METWRYYIGSLCHPLQPPSVLRSPNAHQTSSLGSRRPRRVARVHCYCHAWPQHPRTNSRSVSGSAVGLFATCATLAPPTAACGAMEPQRTSNFISWMSPTWPCCPRLLLLPCAATAPENEPHVSQRVSSRAICNLRCSNTPYSRLWYYEAPTHIKLHLLDVTDLAV